MDAKVEVRCDLPAYKYAAHVVEVFARHGIALLLTGGSLLGAQRHLGILPWGDKDFDFLVLSTDKAAIDRVLDTSLSYEWSYNRDGVGPGEWGFGYHIKLPIDMYVDLWLFGPTDETGSEIQCQGIEGGCLRWYAEYLGHAPPVHNTKVILPPSQVRFGPYLFPAPHNPDAYLDRDFKGDWRKYCKGYNEGVEPCDEGLTDRFVFVFKDGEYLLVKRGESVLLRIKNT